jgi:BED zinc finger
MSLSDVYSFILEDPVGSGSFYCQCCKDISKSTKWKNRSTSNFRRHLTKEHYDRYVLKLTLKLTVFTCSDVTPIDVIDVQQMSQMPDLSGAGQCKQVTPAAAVVAPTGFGNLV